jgi:acetyltransferase-like isoleucine patch superfamily enzyme
MDTDFHGVFDSSGSQINPPEEINVGNNVWVGCRCLVLKGSTIPNGTVVAANSVVNSRPLEGENKIFGGYPLRKLKDDITWKD